MPKEGGQEMTKEEELNQAEGYGYDRGFNDGAASRDAEVDALKRDLEMALQINKLSDEEIESLKAENERLRIELQSRRIARGVDDEG